MNSKAFLSYTKKKTGNSVNVGPLKGDSNKLVTDSKKQADILNTWYRLVFTREDTSSISEPVDVVEGVSLSGWRSGMSTWENLYSTEKAKFQDAC